MKVLYTIGDSFVYRGSENSSWTGLLCEKLGYVDANNGLSGSTNDRIFRSTIRDISSIEFKNSLWTEVSGQIDCELKDLVVVVGWTNPYRFELYEDGEFIQHRDWDKSEWENGLNPSLHPTLPDEVVTNTIMQDTNVIIKFFNQLISLKGFLDSKKIPNLFYNAFFPFNEDTNSYFNSIINHLENTKSKNFYGFDNPNTYLELKSLWNNVPSDYKLHKQLEVCGMNNLDETKHPNLNGHKKWVSYLYEKVSNLRSTL